MQKDTMASIPSSFMPVLGAALLLAPAAAAGQQPGEAAPAQRLDSLTQRVRDLAGHFEAMRKSVEESPSLQDQQGWAGPETMQWTAELGRRLAGIAEAATAFARHLGTSHPDALGDRPERMHDRLERLIRTLEGLTVQLDSLRGVVHGQGGH